MFGKSFAQRNSRSSRKNNVDDEALSEDSDDKEPVHKHKKGKKAKTSEDDGDAVEDTDAANLQ